MTRVAQLKIKIKVCWKVGVGPQSLLLSLAFDSKVFVKWLLAQLSSSSNLSYTYLFVKHLPGIGLSSSQTTLRRRATCQMGYNIWDSVSHQIAIYLSSRYMRCCDNLIVHHDTQLSGLVRMPFRWAVAVLLSLLLRVRHLVVCLECSKQGFADPIRGGFDPTAERRNPIRPIRAKNGSNP